MQAVGGVRMPMLNRSPPPPMQAVGSVRMPSEAEIGSFIPSQRFPSDHLAVVYDLKMKSRFLSEDEESF